MPSKKLARKVDPQPRPQPQAVEPDEDEDEPIEAASNGHVDDDDDAPLTFKIRGGRTEAQRQAEATSSFAKVYRPSGKTDVIKFLEDVPYACYRRHWVPATTAEGKPTSRPYVCHQTGGRECALCEVGDRASGVYSYNIAICGDDGQVLHRTWDMGIRVYKAVDGYSQDPKIAPLTRNFFLVSKSGEGTSTQYNVAPVRASALVEDYDTPVPDQAEIDRLKNDLYTADIIQIETPKRMREIARELAAEY
jgi:hypothetical protein